MVFYIQNTLHKEPGSKLRKIREQSLDALFKKATWIKLCISCATISCHLNPFVLKLIKSLKTRRCSRLGRAQLFSTYSHEALK